MAQGFLSPVAKTWIDSSCDCDGGGNGGDCDGEVRIIADAASAAMIPAILSFLFTIRKVLKILLIICKNKRSVYITASPNFSQRGGEVRLSSGQSHPGGLIIIY